MKPVSSILFCLIFSLTLEACSSMPHNNTKRVVCNLLKSKVIFSGSTYDNRKAQIQNAEDPLNQSTYDRNCE